MCRAELGGGPGWGLSGPDPSEGKTGQDAVGRICGAEEGPRLSQHKTGV